MTTLLVMTLVMMTIVFPFLSHPLSMGLNLMMFTLILSTLLTFMNSQIWLGYALVLVMLGGLLVIFVYVSLTATNETFFTLSNINLASIILFVIVLIMSLQMGLHFIKEDEINSSYFYNSELNWLSTLYNSELFLMTLFLVLYLFLTLIVVVFNTKNKSMTLRNQ